MVVSPIDPELSERLASLTPRQREVLRLVSRDHGSKEIGRALGLSEETVKNHVKAAVRRLGVTSRYDAARLVRLDEDGDPRVVNDPARVIAPRSFVDDDDDRSGVVGGAVGMLREERARFDAEHLRTSPRTTVSPPCDDLEEPRLGLTGMQVLGWIAVLTIAMAIAGIAAAPLARSVQEIANMVERPKQNK